MASDKEIIREVKGRSMRIVDDRPENRALSLNEWDVLAIPFVGEENQQFRTLVLLNDLDAAVTHAFYAAHLASDDGRKLNLDEAHLVRVTYETALAWGLVAGVTGVQMD